MEANGPGTRYGGRVSGLRWEVERCPDATLRDAVTPAAAGGALGLVASLLVRAPGPLRLFGLAAGAALGAFASQYHMNVDWDPDRLRGEPEPPAPPSTPPGEAPADPAQPPQPF